MCYSAVDKLKSSGVTIETRPFEVALAVASDFTTHNCDSLHLCSLQFYYLFSGYYNLQFQCNCAVFSFIFCGKYNSQFQCNCEEPVSLITGFHCSLRTQVSPHDLQLACVGKKGIEMCRDMSN